MQTDEDVSSKKKQDKTLTPGDNLTVSLEKIDGAKKPDKADAKDSKPRIVLTFRSEAKSSNMKIVSTEDKNEEVSPRRSSRTRGKWEWICDSDTSTSPKKVKSGSQPVSENEESDSSHTAKRMSRRRSKDSSDIIASAIARKEKHNDTISTSTPRLSRRIKPTAKVLENEELRMGLESQNNARLGIQNEKSDEGIKTRRSNKPASGEDSISKQDEEIDVDDDSQNSDKKLKHLCNLGLKAIQSDEEGERDEDAEDNREVEENETEEGDDEDYEMDDDSEVISKLLEADEDSGTEVEEDDEDFYCSDEASQSDKPRRSTRGHPKLRTSYEMNDSDHSSPAVEDDERKIPRRRSSRRAGRHSYADDDDRPLQSCKRRRILSDAEEEPQSAEEQVDNSNPAAGDEGSEAACPTGDTTVVATCLCETPSNVHAALEDHTGPVFCQAVEMVDGVRVGCCHPARKDEDGSHSALVRAGPRAPYFLACDLHTKQLRKHMGCPACGLFCTQGVFYQCSERHLFHLDCGLPYNDAKLRPGCPHCGVYSYRWQPVNRECFKVKLEMKCSNKRIFLPDQREQCTQAYLTFSALEPTQLDQGPVIPPELLPCPPINLKELCEKSQAADGGDSLASSPEQVCDAILAGETVEQLIPKIVQSSELNKALESQGGSSCVHVAARTGHLGALYLLHYAGVNIDAADGTMRTPLMLAIQGLLEKSEKKSKEKMKETEKEDDKIKEEPSPEDAEIPSDVKEGEDKTEKDDKTEESEVDTVKPKDEDLMKVIRYLVAAGCDVNVPGPEGMTALHMAAQLGGETVCSIILDAGSAEIDPRDHGGWTPLVWAAENKHPDVVRLLLAKGSDAASTDNEGNAVVHWCALSGDARSLQLLLDTAPHAVHALNAHTDSPLHVAARQGHYACVVILLARGARTDTENSAGELPVEVCSGQCQSAISLNMQMSIAVKDKLVRHHLLSSDISNGRERHPVPCYNEVDDEPAPDNFTYVTDHVMPVSVAIDNTIQTMQGCGCKLGSCSSSACSCCVLGVRRWWARGRLLAGFPYHDPPMLFECNTTCACDAKKCGNSVVSRLSRRGSMLVRAQVFRVGGTRGWGLRASVPVSRGTPVATYCGELLPLALADTRSADQYMFALDVKPDLLEECEDKTVLCVDAAQYGSAARFINHSCRPTLAPVRVFTTTRDLRLPTVVLFAVKDMRAGDEFTFDYGDKFWSVKSKWMKCECGAPDCRYPVKSTEETD